MKARAFRFPIKIRTVRPSWRTWLRRAQICMQDAENARVFFDAFPIRCRLAALRRCAEARACLDRAERART